MPSVGFAATLSVTKNLSFGTLVPVSASGSVTVALNNSINTFGTATLAPTGTSYYAGQLLYKGSGLNYFAQSVSTTFLNSSVTLSNGTGGTVVVNNFTITPNLQVSLANPEVTANVGGTLNFTSNSTAGNYTGSVQVRTYSFFGGFDTVSLPIIATLWRPLTITQTKQLNFGAINVSTGNAVVNMSAQNGNRTIVSGAAGITLISSLPGNPAEFAITGQPNTSINVSLPSSITLTGPGAPMTVNNFSRRPGGSSTNTNSNGNLTLTVGANLIINANQAAGVYNGTYTISVNY